MTQDPNNQLPLVPKTPRTPVSVTTTVGRYVMAFVRMCFWVVLTFAALAFVYVAFRGIIWAVRIACQALGV